MKILISNCLLGNNCKYNGGNNLNNKIFELFKDVTFVPICPEVMGGLSTPRPPAEIVGDKVINNIGIDVTEEYNKGAMIALNTAIDNEIKYAILKAKSPSCGCGKIYDGTFTHNVIDGDGITTRLLKANGIEVFTEDNLEELALILEKK